MISRISSTRAISEVRELLVEAEKDEYKFAHLTFHAFLAAAEIQHLKREDFLVELLQKDWWKDTTLFYAGLVRDTSRLPQKLIAEARRNPVRRTLTRVLITRIGKDL